MWFFLVSEIHQHTLSSHKSPGKVPHSIWKSHILHTTYNMLYPQSSFGTQMTTCIEQNPFKKNNYATILEIPP